MQKVVQAQQQQQIAPAKFELLSDNNNGVKTWRVKAVTVTRSGNGRLYTKDELVAATETLDLRRLNLNHDHSKRLAYPDNSTLFPAKFDPTDNGVWVPIRVADSDVNRKIESGEIKHVSIEQVSNEMCSDATCSSKLQYGMAFTELALLESQFMPGDPKTEIKAEGMMVDIPISSTMKAESHECPSCKAKKQEASMAEIKSAVLDNMMAQLSAQYDLVQALQSKFVTDLTNMQVRDDLSSAKWALQYMLVDAMRIEGGGAKMEAVLASAHELKISKGAATLLSRWPSTKASTQ